MTQASAFERCTASVFIEGSWRGTLRLPADARPGPVAVIGAGDALRQRLARLVTLAGLGSSVLAQASTGPQLTDALRLSLSHEDVAAVVVCDLPAEAIAQARVALREAARAVPLIVLDPAARLASEVIALKWLAAHGIAVTPSGHETIAALPVLIGLEPLTGPTVAVVAADENAVHWLNVEARNAGFEPVGHVMDPRSPAAHELAASTRYDAVVVYVGCEMEAAGVPAAVVLTDGPLPEKLRSSFVAVGALTVDEPPFVAFRWLTGWSEAREASADTAGGSDGSDIRRAATATAARSGSYDERSRAWLRALRVPRLDQRLVAYVEDALVEAGVLGYPVRITAHLEAPPSALPHATTCLHLDALTDAADEALASVRVSHQAVAHLSITRPLNGGADVVVDAWRDKAFGPAVRMRARSGAELVDVQPPARDAATAFASTLVPGADELVADALASTAANVLHALRLDARVHRLSFVLHVAPTGFGASDVFAEVQP